MRPRVTFAVDVTEPVAVFVRRTGVFATGVRRYHSGLPEGPQNEGEREDDPQRGDA